MPESEQQRQERLKLKLIRRYLMRRITLQALKSGKPIHNLDELRTALMQAGVSIVGVKHDDHLRAELASCRIAYVKHVNYPKSILMPMPYHPDRPDTMVDPEIITSEVLRRVASHVRYIDRHDEWVIVNCEKMTGHMFAEPLFLLAWPEIHHVLPANHSVMILCSDAEAAQTIHGRLLGE